MNRKQVFAMGKTLVKHGNIAGAIRLYLRYAFKDYGVNDMSFIHQKQYMNEIARLQRLEIRGY